MRLLSATLVGVALSLFSARAVAEPASIEGQWVTFDKETNQKRSIVEIVLQGRRATGRVIQLFLKPGEDPDPVCADCPGTARDRPIRGLYILAVEAADSGTTYRGTVLDPEDGRVYSCVLTILPDGKHLRVRGFVGLEIFGREETWVRSN